MTVGELIEHLKDFPDDTIVAVYDCEWGYFLAGVPELKDVVEINQGNFGNKAVTYTNVIVI